MEAGAIKKKTAREKFIRFTCPYIDPLSKKPCPQKYFSFKYEGAQKHLVNCVHYDAERFSKYVADKGIKIADS